MGGNAKSRKMQKMMFQVQMLSFPDPPPAQYFVINRLVLSHLELSPLLALLFYSCQDGAQRAFEELIFFFFFLHGSF